LRVLSGRLKAVLVASLATIILIGVIGPATTLASDPPGLARFMSAIGRVESGGDYYARNSSSGAYGKYQIMPASWQAWAGRYLGNAAAAPTPANQEVVAAAKMRSLYAWLGAWRRVAYWWLTGSSSTSGWSYAATRYVSRVMIDFANSTVVALAIAPASADAPTRTQAQAKAKARPPALQRFSETSASIRYGGSWRIAHYARYAGSGAKYATRAGSTASFTFSGTKVTWYGPVGPTRGLARVSIDGVYLKTVNLRSSAFIAHATVFSTSWRVAGKHTLEIRVLGTAGHPYVAIDEFTVSS
jgi:hypothetical protein